MKFRLSLFALLLAPVLVFAGNAAVKPDTPSEVLKKFFQAAFKDFDYETALTLAHGEQKEFIRMLERSMAHLKKSAAAGDAEAQAKLAQIEAKSASFTLEIVDETIRGDFAMVTAVSKIGDQTKKVYAFFMKVDGEWKNISPSDYAKFFKARNGGK